MKAEDKSLAADLIRLSLTNAKLQTMLQIYGRLAPGPDGRIRTKLAPYTETGRLRSGEDDWWEPERLTNLQNLPKKTAKADALYRIRDIIVPDPGYVLIAADLAQAELYAYLAYAGDADKLRALASGKDLHRKTAAAIYGVSPDTVDDVQRMIGKFGNFSLGYGGGWKMFLEKVNKDADLTGVAIDARLAKRAVEAWRRLNPKTVQWWDDVKREVAKTGKLTNVFGRTRVFLSETSTGNDAIAYLPQSTIADHLNHALVRVHESLPDALLSLRLQVHDELLCQAPANKWFAAAKALKDAMARPLHISDIELRIPVEVSYSRTSWGQMEKVAI